ncbi:GntR family transcriptional regulator [Alicyclobacillus fodiniaquatilis]|uniref:GntR family transcriptional regulator n=1 Tax=Alicyclobacillus fodiniaquatilis TaxID=1661150 RepID=A0ABW4JDG6_9BACL
MEREWIEVPSMHGEVYQRLREQIAVGRIQPGEKITIRQIADAFGVSTMPVREALRKLQAEGLVVFERRSVTVRRLLPLEVEQTFAIRDRLELLATEWAFANFESTDIAQMRKMVQKMDEAQASRADWRVLNERFHFYLYRRCESEILIQAIETLWKSVDAYMHVYATGVSSLAHAQRQHHAMIDFIEKRNLKELLELTSIHLKETMETILMHLG